MKKKLNVFDLFLIVLLVCVIAFAGYKIFFSGNKIGNLDSQKAEYTILIKGIKDVSVNSIPENIEIKDDNGISLGKITGKKVTEARILERAKDGSYVIVESDSKYDVEVYATVTGIQKEEGFFFGGKKSYGVGSEIYINAQKLSMQGKIKEMKVTDNN